MMTNRILKQAAALALGGAGLIFGMTSCEQHNWSETKVLFESHGGDHHAEEHPKAEGDHAKAEGDHATPAKKDGEPHAAPEAPKAPAPH